MSSRRHRSSRRTATNNKFTKNNNITLVKLIDPIMQSVLIVLFLYCIDAEKLFSYRTVLYVLVLWQMLSVLFNFALSEIKLLRIQRFLFFVIMSVYMLFFFLYEKNAKEHFVAIDEATKATLPLHRIITMTIAITLAFWYNIICYREIRTILSGVINRGNN